MTESNTNSPITKTAENNQADVGGSDLCLVRLLPCPFCGDLMQIDLAGTIGHASNPNCIIGMYSWHESKATAWNQRTPDLYALDPETGAVSKVSLPNAELTRPEAQ